MRWVVVDALEVTVCFVVNLFTKVLVRLGPNLRKVSWEKEQEKNIFNRACFYLNVVIKR